MTKVLLKCFVEGFTLVPKIIHETSLKEGALLAGVLAFAAILSLVFIGLMMLAGVL